MKTRIHPGLAQLNADMAKLVATKIIEKAGERVAIAAERQRQADRARVLRELDEVLAAGRVQVISRKGQRLVNLVELEAAIAECLAAGVYATEPAMQDGE